ncbi:hypothetical protein OS493_015199 [Desmophyllum pertusum]|uniref:Uncharacterized protein n=1 Tax=Desmophyllum pertusum TaxID=174260 RepID=A0A9W9ZRI2_9CNID|nr:hypothetical protein OS493_015199 [Desmophyllum pertusum]
MPTSRHLVKQHRDEVDEWLSEDPPLFLSRPYQGYRLQLVQAPTSRCHLVNQRGRDEVDELLSEHPLLFLSRLSGLQLPGIDQAPTSRCHLVNQRRDEVDGGARIIKIDAIPPAPGSSASGDESLNEESVIPPTHVGMLK